MKLKKYIILLRVMFKKLRVGHWTLSQVDTQKHEDSGILRNSGITKVSSPTSTQQTE